MLRGQGYGLFRSSRLALIAVAVSASFANSAQAQTAKPYDVAVSYDSAKQLLTARLTETESSLKACDLVLSRLEYLGDISLLNIELMEDFCPMDISGHRKATVKWQLPRALRGKGQLSLRVNGKVIGQIETSATGASFVEAN